MANRLSHSQRGITGRRSKGRGGALRSFGGPQTVADPELSKSGGVAENNVSASSSFIANAYDGLPFIRGKAGLLKKI